MRWLCSALKALAWIAALASIATFVLVALKRLSYPFELEWMEGAMRVAVERVLSQQPIYTPPSLEFGPFPYNPLFYYIAAGVARLFGVGLLSLRLLSFTATVTSFVLIYAIVHLETRGGPRCDPDAGTLSDLTREPRLVPYPPPPVPASVSSPGP